MNRSLLHTRVRRLVFCKKSNIERSMTIEINGNAKLFVEFDNGSCFITLDALDGQTVFRGLSSSDQLMRVSAFARIRSIFMKLFNWRSS